MKAFRIFGRNIRDAFKSVFRNFSLSLASISCITITLLVVAVSIILFYNVNNFTSLVEKDVTIVAFLDKNIKQDKIDEIETKIKTMSGVASYDFRSKDQIKEEIEQIRENIADIRKETRNYKKKIDSLKDGE